MTVAPRLFPSAAYSSAGTASIGPFERRMLNRSALVPSALASLALSGTALFSDISTHCCCCFIQLCAAPEAPRRALAPEMRVAPGLLIFRVMSDHSTTVEHDERRAADAERKTDPRNVADTERIVSVVAGAGL